MSERYVNMFTIDHVCYVVDEDGFGKTCHDYELGFYMAPSMANHYE